MSEKEENKEWVDPESNQVYDLSHTEPAIFTYQVKLSKESELIDVPVKVYFSLHCYSREAKDGEPVHFQEERRHGRIENRIFCLERWEFSKKLPGIISGLQSKGCLVGGSHEVLYRLEDANPRNKDSGWYICMRLSYRSSRKPEVELSIRSVHYRNNRPYDIRGGHQRFYVLLAKLLKKGRK